MYRIMPLKAISRAWGKFNQLELPVVLRRPLLGLYVWMFDCKVDEAMETELQNYKNLGEFFRRVLKPDIRLISQKEELVRRRKTFKIKKKMFKIYMMLYHACPISKQTLRYYPCPFWYTCINILFPPLDKPCRRQDPSFWWSDRRYLGTG